MKSLVIYDSQFGNTRLLAEAIASEFEAVGTVDIERARNENVILPPDLTLLVVGGPTQVHNVSPPLCADNSTRSPNTDSIESRPRLSTRAAMGRGS
jgi:flavodoxin